MVHSNKNAGGTRPPREGFLAVRYYDWIAHHRPPHAGQGRGRSISRASAASPTRSSTRASRASPRICATHAEDRARRPRRGAGAEHDRYAGGAVRLRTARRRLRAAEHPAHRSRAAVHRRRCRAEGDDPRHRSRRDRAHGRKALQRRDAACCSAPAAPTRPASRLQSRSIAPKTSRSMTSRPSCTRRARPASPRARSSPMA